jgi:hypothetical protein
MKAHYIVWAPAQGVPTVKHSTAAEAHAEALRLAEKHPNVDFGIYALTASVRAEISLKTSTVDAPESSPAPAPAIDHAPHLCPVPPEVMPLPTGAIYAGTGVRYQSGEPFLGWYRSDDDDQWDCVTCIGGQAGHYALASNSPLLAELRRAKK